jgi:hypothetical protein
VGLTTDRNDPGLREIQPDGQQGSYLILSEEERRKGFVRPVRRSYTHLQCGHSTKMGRALAETYARDPEFYGGTYCAHCRDHFALRTYGNQGMVKIQPIASRLDWGYAFVWDDDGEGVGS